MSAAQEAMERIAFRVAMLKKLPPFTRLWFRSKSHTSIGFFDIGDQCTKVKNGTKRIRVAIENKKTKKIIHHCFPYEWLTSDGIESAIKILKSTK